MAMFLIIAAIFLTCILVLYLISPLFSPRAYEFNGGHVLVTGGSSGIGKCVAIEAARRGANVTLLARNQERLAVAKQNVEQFLKDNKKQKVVCISVDLGKDYTSVEKAIKQATEIQGPVDMLVNCAGYAAVGRFEDLAISDFKEQMNVNYIGSVYTVRAVLPSMKERNFGRIVFTSSQAGQCGIFGLTAYSASKFALEGFGQALQMEVKPYNIHVTISYPPDTDTPGLALEMVNKPKETAEISKSSGLFQPEYVAKCIVDDAAKGSFRSYVGVDGWMISHLTAGASHATAVTDVIQQVFLMGLFRLIILFFLRSFDKIVTNCKKEREGGESN